MEYFMVPQYHNMYVRNRKHVFTIFLKGYKYFIFLYKIQKYTKFCRVYIFHCNNNLFIKFYNFLAILYFLRLR